VFRPGASLRSIVETVVALLGTVALVTAAALAFVTTDLRRSTGELVAAIESIRAAEETAIALLLHARADDGLVRRSIERDLDAGLAEAARHVTSPEEGAVLRTARDRVDAYLRRAGTAGSLEEASTAIEALVATNLQQAARAEARARTWDRAGDALAVAVLLLLAGTTAWVVTWLRTRAFRPVLALASAMERFGRGDASARAPEAGPAELREMARRFNEMAASLAALRERQMTFLASLAHELRNPLSALKLASAPRPGDGAPGKLAVVQRQVLRLERLVTDFLDTARIEAGQLEVRREPVDLRQVVEAVVTLYEAASPAHRVSAELPRERVVAPCDAGRIEQVLNNLVSNAIKYSPDGGRISLVLAAEPDSAALRVTDEGVGIDAAEAEAIFEPFRRGRGLRPEVPGVGLGLYVSRRIVEAHGGRLRVASAPGRGSTFEVRLPR
jgi:signal transduction histidine kinase